MLKFLRAFCCAVLVLLFVPSALAQLSTAAMFGTITDSTGAALPNATVTITQTDSYVVGDERYRTDVAVSNSLGFGGSNTCLVLRAV